MNILIVGGPSGSVAADMLREAAARCGADLVLIDNIKHMPAGGLVVAVDPASEITGAWIDEAAKIPKELFMEFEIPEPVDKGYGIPYRDRKVMHPWSRRKKR